MIRLHVTNVRNGANFPLEADTNVSPVDLSLVRFVEFKARNSGLGQGFKGRAPNRAVIDMGERQWRTVVFSDDYDMDSVSEVTLVDSKKENPPIHFVRDPKDPLRWNAQHPQARTKAQATTGYSRVYEVKEDFHKKFNYIGGVGVNDLKHVLAVTVEIPEDQDTNDNRNAILDFAEGKLTEKYGTVVAVNFSVTARSGIPDNKQPVGAGHLGMTDTPHEALAGRQPIKPVGVPNNPISAAALQPVSPGWEGEGNEGVLQPGQTGEPYGSTGPQDR